MINVNTTVGKMALVDDWTDLKMADEFGIMEDGRFQKSKEEIVALILTRKHGIWTFDDERVGLIQEPFVGDVNRFFDLLTEGIPDADRGVTILFSENPFFGHSMIFKWLRFDCGGNWYECDRILGSEGWLCPALYLYFDAAPQSIFLRAMRKKV